MLVTLAGESGVRRRSFRRDSDRRSGCCRATQSSTCRRVRETKVGAHLADAIEGMLAGDEAWAAAMEMLPKLILCSVPYGVSINVEIAQRLELWEQGGWEAAVRRS